MGVIVAVGVVRLVFVLAGPVGLAADEAQYWDWSRRLGLSYYSKGPGVAWVIAASTSVFGVSEWSVRLPAVLSGVLTGLGCAALGVVCAPGVRRVALYAGVAGGVCAPVLHALGVLMTIDAPFVAAWAWAGVLGALVLRGEWWPGVRAGVGGRVVLAVVLGAAVGFGFLLKYTALFFVLSLGVYVLVTRGKGMARGAWAMLGVAGLVGGACTLPVWVWNAQHGWPVVKHLLGHLRLPGGDVEVSAADGAGGIDVGAFVLRLLEYVGAQLGLVGPVLVAGFVVGVLALVRYRPVRDAAGAPAARFGEREGGVYLAALGVPVFVVYAGVAAFTDVQGNWPVAGVVGLGVLVGVCAAREVPVVRARVRSWRAAGKPGREGILARKPESWVQIGWDWGVVYGVGGLVVVVSIGVVAKLPVVGGYVPMHRLNEGRVLGEAVQPWVDRVRDETGGDVAVIAQRYTGAAWLAFYLEGRPGVASSGRVRGERASSYDYFEDTALDSAALVGKPAVLVGGAPEGWLGIDGAGPMVFEGFRMVDDAVTRIYVADRYLGLVDEPRSTDAGAGETGGGR